MQTWQNVQQTNFTSMEKLLDFLEFDKKNREKILSHTPFPLNLPFRIAEKIEKNSLNDPLFRQFVPLSCENKIDPNFLKDPVQDKDFQKEKRLLHKYKNRALLLATSACAMHCRYCFRRHFPYEKQYSPFTKELDYIKEHPELNEIILSGGDPLSLADPILEKLLLQIDNIPHIKKIRFHTRFIIGIPERITTEFLTLLENLTSQIYFVIHTNHPNELDNTIFSCLKKVHKTGALVLSQTVLTKGINDDLNTLRTLFDLLSDNGILPYYLHQLDPVQGASHFHVDEEKGKRLMQDLRAHLSGYSIPFFVKEIPHQKSKTVI